MVFSGEYVYGPEKVSPYPNIADVPPLTMKALSSGMAAMQALG